MRKFFTILFGLPFFGAQAQDDLMKELEQSQKTETNYVLQTFKGTRLINGQSVETKGKGELEFIFAHRFDKVNTGSYQVWGLDGYPAVRLGLEYGITDRLGVGVGRNFYYDNKLADLFLRYKVARQSTGEKSFPVTITTIGTVTYQPYPNAADAARNNLLLPSSSDRIGYVLEVLFARKFSSNFSAQVSPIYVHRNAVYQAIENNDDFALSFGGRYKVTRSVSIIGEYCARLNAHVNTPYYNAAGLGIDLETGGHNFQLFFTNSMGLNPQTLVTHTGAQDGSDGNIGKGDVHFGFNITRTFQLGKRK